MSAQHDAVERLMLLDAFVSCYKELMAQHAGDASKTLATYWGLYSAAIRELRKP